ncbi:hypothetical protein [Streptococcus gordonii]|uniref:hypothetical protein n=1 Tax=Streptococcus gordonii TaxID=1302 RepID=UPI001C8C7236|nr:hypothetical protein [Streptococcus gordonii]MBX9098070.1 hypothetical protein [Streptococcus gordonii]
MLKEKRNQGMIGLLFITLIFLGIAGAMAFIQYQKANPKITYSADTAKVSSETVYTEVYDISPEPIFPVNDKTEVWLVQYKDGYVGIQAKKGDKQIAKLVEQANKGELKKNPARLVGTYINTSVQKKDQSYISNFSSLMHSLRNEVGDVTASIATNSYISISELEAENNKIIYYTLFMIGLSIFFIGTGLFNRKKNVEAYNEIYATYPEAKDNLNILLEQASFHDDELKIIIYKDHLITYYRGFRAIDLKQVIQVYHRMFTMYRGFASNRNSTLVVVRSNRKKYQMPIRNIGKSTDIILRSTFDYLYSYHPHIKQGI